MANVQDGDGNAAVPPMASSRPHRLNHQIPARLLTALLFLHVLSVLILSSVPPVSRDALTHHLAVPKLYLEHGGMYEIPSIVFSYYPMNLDLIYMIPLWFGNDIIPKYIHFFFGWMAAWLIFRYLRRRLSAAWGLAGALAFLTIPVVIKLSITAYVDLGLIFFSFAALIGFLKWLDDRFRFRHLMVSAIFCGLALGTKYNALIVFFLLSALVPFFYARTHRGAGGNVASPGMGVSAGAVAYALAFTVAALLVFSPWMIRNVAWKGNPIHPLYQHLFTTRTTPAVDRNEEKNLNNDLSINTDIKSNKTNVKNKVLSLSRRGSKLSYFAIRKWVYGESWWETALVPVRIFFQGRDDSPKYFDGKLNPFLFFFPLVAFFRRRKFETRMSEEIFILSIFSGLFLLITFFTADMRIRYISPIIAPLTVLSIVGLRAMFSHIQAISTGWKKKGCMILLMGAMLYFAGMNAVYLAAQFDHVKPLEYISGRIHRDAYIERYRPEYSVYRHANRHLTNQDKILGLFMGNRRYYCDRPIFFSMEEFQSLVLSSKNSAEILKNLKNRGYTHIIAGHSLFARWMKLNFEPEKVRVIKEFFSHRTQLLFQKGGYGLYALK